MFEKVKKGRALPESRAELLTGLMVGFIQRVQLKKRKMKKKRRIGLKEQKLGPPQEEAEEGRLHNRFLFI